MFVVYAVVSRAQVLAAVFFNKPEVPESASIAYTSEAPVISLNA